jgi:uncharacterized repeat protein (TIGR01451 family)
MTDSPDPVGAGGNITYTIVVTNNGSGAATSVLGSNVLPTNTTFVSLDVPTGWTGGPNSQNPQQIQFGTQSLASGATATLMLVVHVDNATPGGTIITNTASVGAQTDPDQHSATTTTTVGAVTANSDLGVTISDTPDPIVAGQNITYTIVVTNSGPDAAANALLNAAVPTNTTFVSFTAPAGWTPSAPAVGGTGPVQATNPSVANGSTSTFTLVVRVNDANSAGSVITANANIGSDTSDTVANNNGATTSTTIAETPPVGETPPTVTSVARFGFHMQPTTLVVTFSTNLDAATATNASNFTLLSPGRDGRFGTHDDRVIRLREVRYDPDSLAVLLSPARRLPLRKTFRLIVRDGVTDSTGNRLDGDADGNAGGQFVAQIDRSLLAGPASALAARVAAHQATPTARVAQIVNKRPAKRR